MVSTVGPAGVSIIEVSAASVAVFWWVSIGSILKLELIEDDNVKNFDDQLRPLFQLFSPIKAVLDYRNAGLCHEKHQFQNLK